MTNPMNDSELRTAVIEALKTVHDPEIPVNLYDLGLIYDIDIDNEGSVTITMTLTTPNCPVAESMPTRVRDAVLEAPGVLNADVRLVWEPAWTRERMTEDGKLQLEFMGINWKDPIPGGFGAARVTPLTLDRDKRKHD